MARFCTTCGRSLIEGDLFCTGCGTPIPQTNRGGMGVSAQSGRPAGLQGEYPSAPSYDSPPAGGFSSGPAGYGAPPLEFGVDTESDLAATEVWNIPTETPSVDAGPSTAAAQGDVPPSGEWTELPSGGGTGFGTAGTSDLSPSGGWIALPGLDSATGAPGAAAQVATGSIDGLAPSAADDDAAGADEDADESPTIVAQPLDDDDEGEDSPTIVVARERYVLVRDEDGQRTELSLPCILGRGKAADKKVKGNLAISRKHAKLFKEDGRVLVQDLESTNGTFVNGAELEGDQCEPVEDGAAIRLGTEDFTFHVEAI